MADISAAAAAKLLQSCSTLCDPIDGSPRGSPVPGYDGDLSLPLGLALGSPIFPSGCEGKLGVALESLQGLRDLT